MYNNGYSMGAKAIAKILLEWSYQLLCIVIINSREYVCGSIREFILLQHKF